MTFKFLPQKLRDLLEIAKSVTKFWISIKRINLAVYSENNAVCPFSIRVKVRSHRALALAATLGNGYNTHSLCSISVAANTNALCEYSDLTLESPLKI